MVQSQSTILCSTFPALIENTVAKVALREMRGYVAAVLYESGDVNSTTVLSTMLSFLVKRFQT
jgi:hypothetical protein